MTTAAAIIRSALGKLGVVASHEQVRPNDAQDCLRSLNLLLDSWRVENLYAYARQTVTATLPAGTQTVSIGPSPATLIVAKRPTRIEGGFFRVSGVDYPFRPLTPAQWNEIPTKGDQGIAPEFVLYDATLPSGTLTLVPALQASALASIDVQQVLTEFADLATQYELPPGYEAALVYTLAEHVAADFEREIPPTVARNAANARRALRSMNLRVGQLDTTEAAAAYGGA